MNCVFSSFSRIYIQPYSFKTNNIIKIRQKSITQFGNTCEPALSGPPLTGHTLLNGHMSKSQKYLLFIFKDKTATSIKRPRPPSSRPKQCFFINFNLF